MATSVAVVIVVVVEGESAGRERGVDERGQHAGSPGGTAVFWPRWA